MAGSSALMQSQVAVLQQVNDAVHEQRKKKEILSERAL